jgi:hypothetical protein
MPRQVRVSIPSVEDVLPAEFRKHMLQAYKEFLFAFRSLVDEQIRRIEELESGKARKVIKKIEID